MAKRKGIVEFTGFPNGNRYPKKAPTITIMIVALASTKVPILMEKGFWDMAHEARTDWSMLLGSVFLLIVGSGPWGLDARLAARPDHEPA